MLRHPTKKELMAFTEGQMEGRISAKTARHVTKCKRCSGEVKGMRTSLEFMVEAPELAASEGLTSSILTAARRERRAVRMARSRRRVVFGVVKGLACAAAIVLVAAVSFRGALGASQGRHAGRIAQETSRKIAKAPSPEEIRKTAVDISTLAEAVGSRGDASAQSLEERQHRRTVLALDADLSAALVALRENPGCRRAGDLVNANLQRQAQALKRLYVERSL